jgi:hypothetical protein
MGATPTVVLVHGAFADASGYGGVIRRLQAVGLPVRAPMNPCVASRSMPMPSPATRRASKGRFLDEVLLPSSHRGHKGLIEALRCPVRSHGSVYAPVPYDLLVSHERTLAGVMARREP